MFQEELRCQRRKKQKRKRDNERRGQSLAGFFQRTNSTNLDQSKGPSSCEGPVFCIELSAVSRSRMPLQPGIVARRSSLCAHRLGRHWRRIDQRRRAEVKKLQHVVLRGIALSQRLQIEAGLE